MHKAPTALAVLFVASCGAPRAELRSAQSSPTLREPTTAPVSVEVTLPSLEAVGHFARESVFSGFGCDGQNRSPAVRWSKVPGAKSYAIILHDPDAPTGVGFFHWVVLDVPATTTELPVGASRTAIPAGAVEAHSDFGDVGYGGPCPPPGSTHHYELTVYAVDVPSLGLPPGATGALARFALGAHTLALGRASATYGR